MANIFTYANTNTTVPNGGNYTITPAGLANSGMVYTTSGTGQATWATNITQASPKVKITETDIELDGVSLRTTLLAIQDRLAILVPDPKKLEQFEALKQAYDHFKTLEALCLSEQSDKK